MKSPGKGSDGPKGSSRKPRVLMMLAVLSGLLVLATLQPALAAASVSGEDGQLGPQATRSDLAYLPPEVNGRYVFYG